jgi:hypothetical protein
MARTRTTKADDNEDKKKSSWSTIFKKLIIPNSKPNEESFPELPNVIFWLRAFLAIALGLYLGVHQITGAAVLMHVLNALCFVPVIYTHLYLGVKTDGDQFGGIWKMIWSGMAPAMALCLLVWIYMLTATQEREIELLNKMLVNATAKNDMPVTAFSESDRIPDGSEAQEF